jgi:hypothetical protein
VVGGLSFPFAIGNTAIAGMGQPEKSQPMHITQG